MAATANDPFAFGDETTTQSTAPEQSSAPSPAELAAAIQAEKRKRLAASIQRAADLLDSADILILHTGAGWSADSGLPIYRDVATHPAMRAHNLTYRDICDPTWLDVNPQLFIGFWGHCFNQYRDTLPHDGYDIVRRWRDERWNDRTDVARRIQAVMERLRRKRRTLGRDSGDDEWQDEEDVVMQRDKGIVHPPEERKAEDEKADSALSQRQPVALAAEAERVHITSTLTLREGDEVRYSVAVDSSTAHLSVAAVEASSGGIAAAQSFTFSSETTAIHTPSGDPTTTASSPQVSAAAQHTLTSPAMAATSTSTAQLSPADWERKDDEFVRTAQRRHVQASTASEDDEEDEDDNTQHNKRPPAASAFFALTSNVDAHFHRAGFEPHELYELHGNSETWQCSQLCSFDTWRPPPHFRFTINQTTLTAPYIIPPPLSSIHISTDSDDDDDTSPSVHAAAHSQSSSASAYWTPTSSFACNVPRCPLGHYARPNILMFNDSHYLRSSGAERRYLHWMHAMLDVVERDAGLSVAVVEIGCGLNVPTVRWRSESVWSMMRQRRQSEQSEAVRRGERSLIRVNVMESRIDVEGRDESCVSVELGGLAFVRIVDRLLEQKKRSRFARTKRKAAEQDSSVS